MPRNIVVCSDGTGNEFGARNTNVVKLFRLLDLSDPDRQIAFYDPGVGTSPRPGAATWARKKLSVAAGMAFGAGLSRNITDAYAFLMHNFEANDRVYLFGFSRGAYTVRALAGMLHMFGLIQPGGENLIPYALKMHRQRPPDFEVAAGFKETFSRPCKPHFVGVWDTVKTVGLWDALKTRTFKSRETALPYTFDMPDVAYGRHAIAIDELRTRFRTNKWKMPDGDRHQQVWFAGVHSDVGGGYPEAGLSDLALRWMAEGAASREMLVDRAALDAISGEPTASAHDSIGGMWKLLGGKPRTIPPGAWVHESVQRRVEAGIALATTPPPDAKYVS